MVNSPLVSVMAWTLFANSIVSPLLAVAIVFRSEPGPLSRLFRTVSV
jgi:hypothetical protein